MTESVGFWIKTESLAAFGLKSAAESLNGFGFSLELNPQFEHPNSKPLKKGVEPLWFSPNFINRGQDNKQD